MPHVFFFGDGATEGGTAMKPLLGSKGANLAEMSNIGIPVPPGFTISTEMCVRFLQNQSITAELREEVEVAMARLEEATGRTFGGSSAPLLVSVRS